MSETPNTSRGDREVDLGSLGKIVCRPGLRALEAIDVSSGSIAEAVRRFARGGSLRDVVTILYETHLDHADSARSAKRFTREQIGAGVLEVGMNKLARICAELIGSAYSFPKDEQDDDEGND